eukprot:4040026-Pyramimonas_sp.AAC.1
MSRIVSRAYVDDIAHNMACTEQELLAHVLPAATLFAQEVDKLGLALSSKSALVCSSPAVGAHLADSLQALRLPIRYRAETRDLGSCATAGRRRRIPQVERRRLEARRRACKVSFPFPHL